MPPKLPNLKYKPRLVRPKSESESVANTDELTIVQIERLRLQQEAQQQQPQQHPPGVPVGGKTHTVAPPPSSVGEKAPMQRGAASGKHQSASAAVIAAERSAMYLTAASDRFPANTMSNILQAEAENPNMSVYPPTPLDSTLPARLVSGDGNAPVEGDDQRVEATTQDGTMFLKEYEEELCRSHRANHRFHHEVLQASSNRIDMGTSDPHGEGELVWFQMPRFQSEVPFKMTQLPPGKVGEVKVYKSGRMVMEICGVHYELAVDGYTAAGDGACNVATAVLPPQTEEEKANCYQLGLVTKKIVCSPTISSN